MTKIPFPPMRGRFRHSGFTLIEVMVGMVLTALLVVGLSGVWTMVADQFFRLTLRQKAIFVLHGHMERIASLYRVGDTGPARMLATAGAGYAVIAPAEADSLHLAAHPNQIHWVLISNSINAEDLVIQHAAANPEVGNILYDPDNIPADRNIVWIMFSADPTRRITGRLSWTLDNIANAGACFGANNCQELTLYLDFPYRPGVGNLLANSMWDQPQTLTLKTIVGQRY
ncbi:MAG: prepilin-type N-terminal cleavage/methylation domain-containing protein [Magnetococcus sp. DMHC-1]